MTNIAVKKLLFVDDKINDVDKTLRRFLKWLIIDSIINHLSSLYNKNKLLENQFPIKRIKV